MKLKIIFTIVLEFAICKLAFPQSSLKDNIFIKGQIIQQDNSQPLAYASIGLVNQPLGTLSDSLGNFSFQVLQQNLNDTLQISLVGYISKRIAVNQFINSNENLIKLDAKIEELPIVVVINSKNNIEIIGKKGSGKLTQVSIHNKKSVEETIGSEMGMRYKTKHLNTFLKDFNFYISANNFTYIKFRINIYSVQDEMPDTLICKKQIFMRINNFLTGWIKINLEDYNIKVDHDFIVTAQWVESRMDNKENPLTLIPVAMTPFSKNCYVRIASQDKWKKMGMNLSNFITLIY